MQTPQIITLMLVSICVLAILAERARVSQTISFLLGGVALAFIPGIRNFSIEPHAILTIFLPPLLMEAAYFTSWRDFLRNLHHITQLAVGLVIATTVAVAFVFKQMLPDASWAVGFVLGAIVSPPDAVAATSILRNTRVPRRIMTILEGESLVNDAVGLVVYQFAVAAVMTSQFSWVSAGGHFLWMLFGGGLLGLGVARVYVAFFGHIRERSIEILSTFVVPYLAYLLAESLGASGVLAVVTSGLYIGWNAPSFFSAQLRIPAEAVWKMVSFVLSALVFILIGLRIPSLFEMLTVYSPATLLGYAGAICATAVIVRFVYIFITAYALKFLLPFYRKNEPYPPWQNAFLVAFVGMRGVVSLATALALPVSISWGVDFPYRDLITFLALSLIVFTLVIQGLMLPWLVRRLSLTFDPKVLHEDWSARVQAAREALTRLGEIEAGGHPHTPAMERIRSYYKTRLDSLGDGPNTPLFPTEAPDSASHPLIQAENGLWQETLAIERNAVIQLRQSYAIGDDVMHDILRELDLLATRFG